MAASVRRGSVGGFDRHKCHLADGPVVAFSSPYPSLAYPSICSDISGAHGGAAFHIAPLSRGALLHICADMYFPLTWSLSVAIARCCLLSCLE
jgi:hypothetical protein